MRDFWKLYMNHLLSLIQIIIGMLILVLTIIFALMILAAIPKVSVPLAVILAIPLITAGVTKTIETYDIDKFEYKP